MFPQTLPSASASSGACEAGKMGPPAATSSPATDFLLFYSLHVSKRTSNSSEDGSRISPGHRVRATPPSHSSGFSFNFVDSGCGVLWRVLFFRDLPRAMGRPGAISCIVPGPAFRLHGTCQAESLCSSLSKYLTFSEARAISARSQLLLFSKLITKLLSSTIYTTRPKKWSIGSS
jgi:hypothetical protein